LFLTRGKGYYEQYKAQESLSDYGLPDHNNGGNIISETDLIRRLWLDNNFYGSVFSLQYNKAKRQVMIGGGMNQYDGKHFGEIIWAKETESVPANYRYYNLDAHKKDYSAYAKWTEQLGSHWQTL
jgi:iron complex outermembrane receptor protein